MLRGAGALLTAAFIVLSLPSPDLGWLAWIALTPLVLACEGLGPGGGFALGLLSGVAAAFGVFRWLFEVPGFGMRHALLLALYVGSYLAVWCAGLRLLSRGRLPLLITAPALWVGLEYLRAHAGFLALPLASLAQTQHRDLAVLQVASLTGEAGITFLVVMGSVAAAGILARRTWREAAAAALVIAVAHAGGALALAGAGPGSSLLVALVQPSIGLDERRTAAGRAMTLDRLERLTRGAAATHPAVVVWPETAVGDLSRDPRLETRLQALAQAIRTPLVVGSSEIEKFAPDDGRLAVHVRAHNSAYLVAPDAPLGDPYRKMRLVPFGEYLPLEGIVSWPAWLVPKIYDLAPGEIRRQFTLTDGTRLGALICWENLFAVFVRSAVADGAQVLIQLTNDAWFGRTAAPYQHNLASVIRAVENRTPVVIASNAGPSQIIDSHGRVVAGVPAFKEGFTTAEISLGVGGAPYTRFGDLVVFAALACLLFEVVRGVRHDWLSR